MHKLLVNWRGYYMNIQELCSILLEFISFYIIIKSFLHLSFIPGKKDIIACGVTTLVVYTCYPYTILTWFLALIFYLVYICILSKNRFINNLLLYCISYITIFLTQVTLIFIFAFFNITYNDQYIPIAGNLLTIAILLILLFSPYQKLYSFISKSALIYKIVLINTYLVCAALLLYMKLNTFNFYQNISYFITTLALIIAINACILYYDQKLFSEHQLLVSYQKNLPIYKSLIDEIRASQHEFSNRIQNLEQLPYICKDYDSICTALLKNTNIYKKPLRAYSLLQLNMPLLAATLYNLYRQANEKDITILFDISSPNLESHAPEYELSDFISILTQNAIEACSSEDKIYTHIVSTEGKLNFEIRNPIKQQLSTTELSQFFQKGFSTKTNHIKKDGLTHGLGLYHLSNKISLYNGTIGVDCAQYENKYWIIFNLEI